MKPLVGESDVMAILYLFHPIQVPWTLPSFWQYVESKFVCIYTTETYLISMPLTSDMW